MIVRSPKCQGKKTFKVLTGTYKKEGRGAYLCNNRDCFLKAKKGKRLEKSFPRKLNRKFMTL